MAAIANPIGHKENAFARHIQEYPKGDKEEMRFKVDIIKAFERQIWEGVEIHAAKPDVLMNNKLDHYQPAVGRVQITTQVRSDH